MHLGTGPDLTSLATLPRWTPALLEGSACLFLWPQLPVSAGLGRDADCTRTVNQQLLPWQDFTGCPSNTELLPCQGPHLPAQGLGGGAALWTLAWAGTNSTEAPRKPTGISMLQGKPLVQRTPAPRQTVKEEQNDHHLPFPESGASLGAQMGTPVSLHKVPGGRAGWTKAWLPPRLPSCLPGTQCRPQCCRVVCAGWPRSV